jgi:hypothetical protein
MLAGSFRERLTLHITAKGRKGDASVVDEGWLPAARGKRPGWWRLKSTDTATGAHNRSGFGPPI